VIGIGGRGGVEGGGVKKGERREIGREGGKAGGIRQMRELGREEMYWKIWMPSLH
jgi:hypothetical protein